MKNQIKEKYNSLFELTEKMRDPIKGKLIGRNVRLSRCNDGTIVIRYHQTDILFLTKDSFELHTGGWYTFTTKEKMSTYLPSGIGITQNLGKWFICLRTELKNEYKWEYFEYKDGVTVKSKKDLIPADLKEHAKKYRREKYQEKKRYLESQKQVVNESPASTFFGRDLRLV